MYIENQKNPNKHEIYKKLFCKMESNCLNPKNFTENIKENSGK